jgi:hypothetical protein
MQWRLLPHLDLSRWNGSDCALFFDGRVPNRSIRIVGTLERFSLSQRERDGMRARFSSPPRALEEPKYAQFNS